MSASGISWAICKSAARSRQITTPAPDHLVFYRPDALPAAQPTASKHLGAYKTLTKSLIHNQRLLTSSMSHWICCMSSTLTQLPVRTCLNQRVATYRLVSTVRLSLRCAWDAGRNIESMDSDLVVPTSWLISDSSDKNSARNLSRSFVWSTFERRASRQQPARIRVKRSSSLWVLKSPRSNSRTLAPSSCTSIRQSLHRMRSQTLRVL